MADLSLVAKPAQAAGKKGAAGNNTKPGKSHSECVAELQGFIEKRIKLFEDYAKRESDAVQPCTSSTSNNLYWHSN